MPEQAIVGAKMTPDSLVGVHACGCMTIWSGQTSPSKEMGKGFSRIIAEGGEVRRVRLDDVRDLPEKL